MADVRRNKALAGVLERAVITDESGNPVDLSSLTAEPTDLVEAGMDEDGRRRARHAGHDHSGHDHSGHDHAGHDHA